MLGGLVGGFICAMVTIFKKEWSPVTAPIYALLEGLVLGGISAVIDLRYPGHRHPGSGPDLWHALRAAAGLPLGNDQGDPEVSPGNRRGHRRHRGLLPARDDSGLLRHPLRRHQRLGAHRHRLQPACCRHRCAEPGARFRFHRAAACSVGAPKYMEWYGAFGIMVTLVWLYLEILRLLSKMRSRN